MSDWPVPAHRPSTRVFMNHSNGHMSTELLAHDSPFRQHYNSYNDNVYHYGNGYTNNHQTDNAVSSGYNDISTQSLRQNSITQGYAHHSQIPNNRDSLPQVHHTNTLETPRTETWGTRSSLQGSRLSGSGMPPRNGNPSLFDLLAKTQLQRGYSNRGRRASIRRCSKTGSGFVDTLAVLRQTNSPSNVTPKFVKEERLSISGSDDTSDYTSVFKQIREVNRESKTETEFIVKSFRILRNTAVMTIFLVMVLLLPFGMVVLGVKYLHECPKEPFLPIYLLVGGCFTTLKMFTVLWRQMRERKNSDSFDGVDGENKSDFITDRSTQFTDAVLSLFLLAWFLYGNYLTWSIYMPSFSRQLHSPSDWCEKSLYMFCVIQIIACYSVFIIFLWTLACLCCARHICCFKDKNMAEQFARS